jgi:hypothetical protein
MNFFEEDFNLLLSNMGGGFSLLNEEAQLTLRAVAFSMWVKGIQRAQSAQAEGGMFKLAASMIEETVNLMHKHAEEVPLPGSKPISKEKFQ